MTRLLLLLGVLIVVAASGCATSQGSTAPGSPGAPTHSGY
jgi:hypothetical protein